MGSYYKHLIFTTFLLSFFLQFPSPTSATPKASVKDICDKTSNPAFCRKTLNSDPRTPSATTVLSLAKIALDLAMKDSSKTRDFINGLVNSKTTKPIFKPVLKQCVGFYTQAKLCFSSAYREVEEGEYQTANYDVLIAADDVGYCEKALADAKASIKSISDRIQVTRYFSSIGDRVTSVLQDSHHPVSN